MKLQMQLRRPQLTDRHVKMLWVALGFVLHRLSEAVDRKIASL